jgi:hypothetical protein
MGLGAPEVLILVAGWAVPIGLAVWAIVDLARRPEDQFTASGQNRVLWVLLVLGSLVLCGPLGIILSIVYLASVRRKLDSGATPSVSDGTTSGIDPEG